jgi:hypothetical protein
MFVKGHQVFEKIYPELKAFRFDISGTTYETGDSYATLWKVVESKDHANDVIAFWSAIRKTINEKLGYPMLSTAKHMDRFDGGNPYTKDVVYIEVLPEEKGRLTEELAGGDALAAAYIQFIHAGGELRIGNELYTKKE